MDTKALIAALKRLKVETGAIACWGCGHEHNCSLHGCAIIREAADCIEELAAKYEMAISDLVKEPRNRVNDEITRR